MASIIPFSKIRTANIPPAIRMLTQRNSTAYSVIVRCTPWAETAAAIIPIGENGLKGCSSCLLPHKRENYGYILSSFGELAKVAQGGTDLDSPIIDPAKG